jgi:hypothetical protein
MEFNLDIMRVPLDSLTPKEHVNLEDNLTLESLVTILKDNQVYVPKGGYHAYIRSPQWKIKSGAMRAYFKTCAICETPVKSCAFIINTTRRWDVSVYKTSRSYVVTITGNTRKSV